MLKNVLEAVRGAPWRGPGSEVAEAEAQVKRTFESSEPAGRSERSLEGQVKPTRRAGPDADPVLARIRSSMDDVSYSPGRPNVLSMTKYVQRAVGAPGGSRRDVARRAEPATRFSRRDAGDETVLEARGILDAVTCSEFRPLVDAVVAERRSVVTIDLAGLRRIDSTGVGVVVGAFKRCTAYGGTVRLVGVKEQPLAIFRLLQLDRVFSLG